MGFLVGLPVFLFFFASRIQGFMTPFVPHFTTIGSRIVGSALLISGVDSSYPNCGQICVNKRSKNRSLTVHKLDFIASNDCFWGRAYLA